MHAKLLHHRKQYRADKQDTGCDIQKGAQQQDYLTVSSAAELVRNELEGLSFTQKSFHRTSHVSGQELVEGVKSLAVRKYGSLAFYVLQTWGVRTPLDIGRIVFIMIDHGLLSRRDEDTLQDFMLDF
ncbi:MAG: hypothetical protein EOM68_17585, partial [Spirochaetia bacterium]|nr:hypothetical protein [Spirochaetia bacterium]